jgi:hypothetical protein
MKNTLLIIAIVLVALSCTNPKNVSRQIPGKDVAAETSGRGIYHWKTTFDLTHEDTTFLNRHGITRLYVRMFDVGMERNESTDSLEVVPLGTTRFISRIPAQCDYVPTVYITLKALKAYNGRESDLADLIIRRIYAMCSWNELGTFDEIQYDCDWTEETKESFELLCSYTKRVLERNLVSLSGTIRLHQIEEATYPFDKGVLMIYNTGSFANPQTKNSIIDYDDVHKYLSVRGRIDKFIKARKENCPHIEMAYPTYGWGVLFDEDGRFRALVTDKEACLLSQSCMDNIRIERSEYEEIVKVKKLVDSVFGEISCGNVIYHLDANNLSKYESHEIENILN